MIQERNTPGTAWFRGTSTDGTVYDFSVNGGDRRALESLIHAERRGCSCFSHSLQNWSVFIFRLRRQGIQIEVHIEPHFGDFPGTHARYVLVDKVVRLK
jgi:hypothetical protein